MNLILDPITAEFIEFAKKNIFRIAREANSTVFQTNYPIIFPQRDAGNDIPDHAKQLADHLMRLIIETCKNNELYRLLILFRKIPYQLALTLFHGRSILPDLVTVATVFEETIFFATNCVLKYSNNTKPVQNYLDRYHFKPIEKEFEDALKVFIYSLYHRNEMFYLNSLSRRSITTDISYFALLNIYNERLKLQRERRRVNNPKNNIIVPALITGIKESGEYFHVKLKNDKYSLHLKKFLPQPIDSDKELELFSFLDTHDFENVFGLNFRDWWKIWLGLNAILTRALIFFWNESILGKSELKYVRSVLDHSDDYTETALGGASIDVIVRYTHEFLEQRYKDSAPSSSTCLKFISKLTQDQLQIDERFTEQPILFYVIGENIVLWDYLRHGGLLKAIARKLITNFECKEIKNIVGREFERYIKIQIGKNIPDVKSIKDGVKIKQEKTKRVLWDIDVGFVFNKVLFLVEAKRQFKSLRYYLADGVDVSARALEFERLLRELDQKLVKHKEQVQKVWNDEIISGAICVICTTEAEFITSFDSTFWFPEKKVPRICLIKELLGYFKTSDVSVLKNHPNFVAFR